MKFKEGFTERKIIVRCAADKFLPFALVFGIYIILTGGGFQGGVLVGGGVLLIYLAYGLSNTSKVFNLNVLRVNEACATTSYIFLGALGIFMGANFARNVFYNIGDVGDFISAGTITFMSYSVGYNVLTGVSFLMLMMLGLLLPGGDFEDDKGEGLE